MSESLGPLDKTWELGQQAILVDDMLAGKGVWPLPEDALEAAYIVKDLSQQHPLLNQEVTAYGRRTNVLLDDEGMTTMSLPTSSQELALVEGVYTGMEVMKLHDVETGVTSCRVVHQVSAGSHEYHDEFGHLHVVQENQHIAVSGSEIIARYPVNTHSLVRLKGDRFIAECDERIINAKQISVELIKELGTVVNRMLHNTEEDVELNFQRISYINSLNLLDKLRLVTRDIAFISPAEDASKTDVVYSDLSKIVSIEPGFLLFDGGYERGGDGKIYEYQTPELYALTRLQAGKIAMTPIKAITGIEKEAA